MAKWFSTVGNMSDRVPDLVAVVDELKAGGAQVGAYGLCWVSLFLF